MNARGKPTPNQKTEDVRSNDPFLFERVLGALGDRRGYYIQVGEENFGPLDPDAAYQLWEDQMQGEVVYFDGKRFLNPDGTPR